MIRRPSASLKRGRSPSVIAAPAYVEHAAEHAGVRGGDGPLEHLPLARDWPQGGAGPGAGGWAWVGGRGCLSGHPGAFQDAHDQPDLDGAARSRLFAGRGPCVVELLTRERRELAHQGRPFGRHPATLVLVDEDALEGFRIEIAGPPARAINNN